MSIIKPNNNTISAITALPAGVAGMDYLGTTTISSGVTTVDITLDTTNYGTFKFMLNGVQSETDDDSIRMRYSIDGGSSFKTGSTDYGYASWEQRQSGSFSSNIDNDTDNFPMTHGETKIGTAGSERTNYEITFWNNNLYPKVSCIGGGKNDVGNFAHWYRTAVFFTTSTVNAVRFYWTSGGFDGGTIDRYGLSK